MSTLVTLKLEFCLMTNLNTVLYILSLILYMTNENLNERFILLYEIIMDTELLCIHLCEVATVKFNKMQESYEDKIRYLSSQEIALVS